MPIIEQELTKLDKSRFYATFDLSHGNFQMPLDNDSIFLQSSITSNGIYSPTRVLHGPKNAVTFFKS